MMELELGVNESYLDSPEDVEKQLLQSKRKHQESFNWVYILYITH